MSSAVPAVEITGRAIFAAVLGFLAVGNLLDLSGSIEYAQFKGVPAASIAVPLGSLLLLAGAAGVALGVSPGIAALAVILFLVGVTPLMHDFWTMEGQDRENEMVHFLKNVGLVGAALVFVGLYGLHLPVV